MGVAETHSTKIASFWPCIDRGVGSCSPLPESHLTPGQLHLPPARELALDYVVERKRMADLCGSIIDGRFREQKVRGNVVPKGLRRGSGGCLDGVMGWEPGWISLPC